ncbi:MAG: quinone-dependent dihydroorotate dehydrogenase [Blastocatellia bacterium]
MPGLFQNLIRPALFGLSPETAHEIGIRSLHIGLGTEAAQQIASKLFTGKLFGSINRFGLDFTNPLGIAAGFDKNGVVVNQLASLGFGFVEVGTVTYKPQRGNDKPRLFRLNEDQALINRLGFNNHGAEVIAQRLAKIKKRCIVGVNIGKNKDVPNEDAVENYLASFDLVHPHADYIAVNISSPNTPNLRELQQADNLDNLLSALQNRNRELKSKPILVKIAPDLNEVEIESIVDVCLRLKIDGIIATNTTTSREGLKTKNLDKLGAGGLSGKPLKERSNAVISMIYRYSNGKLPIVGIGGIFTANDAFEKVVAGASMLQAYTGFIYIGPSFAREINEGLLEILSAKGFAHIDEAVGSGER